MSCLVYHYLSVYRVIETLSISYCTVDIQVIDAFILFLILLTLTVGLGNGRTEMLSKVLTFVSFKISV